MVLNPSYGTFLVVFTSFLVILQFTLYEVTSHRISGGTIETSIRSLPVQLTAAFCLGILSISLLDIAFDAYSKFRQGLLSKVCYFLPALFITVLCLGSFPFHVAATLFVCASRSADFIVLGRSLLDLNSSDTSETWSHEKGFTIMLFFALQNLENLQQCEIFGVFIRVITFAIIFFNSCLCIVRLKALRNEWTNFTQTDIQVFSTMTALCILQFSVALISPAVIRFEYLSNASSEYISIQIIARAIFIVLAMVVPSLSQKQRTGFLEHNLTMKGNFVRYLSHEIRYVLHVNVQI